MSHEWHIAQFNIAKALYPHDDPRMSRFFAQIDETNALAESNAGFVWRLESDSGNATDIRVDDDPLLIVNMSVWESVEALFDFAYKSAHRKVMSDRRQWFERPDGAYQVLWWVQAGNLPTVDDGMARLRLLDELGPTPSAFTFKAKYPPPDDTSEPEDMNPDPFCAGWE